MCILDIENPTELYLPMGNAEVMKSETIPFELLKSSYKFTIPQNDIPQGFTIIINDHGQLLGKCTAQFPVVRFKGLCCLEQSREDGQVDMKCINCPNEGRCKPFV